jgi:hypothetical protein
MAVSREEGQLSGGEGLFQVVQELAPEHMRQHSDWQEEPWPAGNPVLAVRRDATRRNEKMNVWMVQQVLSVTGVQGAPRRTIQKAPDWVCPRRCRQGCVSPRSTGLRSNPTCVCQVSRTVERAPDIPMVP